MCCILMQHTTGLNYNIFKQSQERGGEAMFNCQIKCEWAGSVVQSKSGQNITT